MKPLLDALVDGDTGQQRVAIDILGFVENKNAGPALFSFATGSADTALRVRAMIACGSLKDASLLPRYEGFLFPKGQAGGDGSLSSDAIEVAASWSVARMGDKRAIPILRALMRDGVADVRAFAAVGLGLVNDRGSIPHLAQIARSMDAGHAARAAAIYALGALAAHEETATLLKAAEEMDPLPRQMALIALARLNSGRGKAVAAPTIASMADAVFSSSDDDSARARQSAEAVRHTGTLALVRLANDGKPAVGEDPFPVPDGPLNVETDLERLVSLESTDAERSAALNLFGSALKSAAMEALQTSTEGARAVMDALAPGPGSLAPFIGAGQGGAHDVARDIAFALEPAIVSLAKHPDPAIRMSAVVLLARSPSDAATMAIVDATKDASEAVQRVALAAVGSQRDPRAVSAVANVLLRHDNWAIRVLAAQALGRLGDAGDARAVLSPLREAAIRDPYALVREAALRAVFAFDPKDAGTLSASMAKDDAEPRVREVARDLARGGALSAHAAEGVRPRRCPRRWPLRLSRCSAVLDEGRSVRGGGGRGELRSSRGRGVHASLPHARHGSPARPTRFHFDDRRAIFGNASPPDSAALAGPAVDLYLRRGAYEESALRRYPCRARCRHGR